MSFVITTVSPETVVQLSDTRLSSLADQSVLSESLRKSLVVKGTEAQFVLGWTGLATTESGHSTADWLFRVLFEMNAVRLSPEQLVGNLAELATAQFRMLRAADKRSEFVLGGWHKSEPFVGVISNYVVMDVAQRSDSESRHHIPSFSEASVAAAKFQGWVERFRNLTERHYVVSVIGDCDPKKLKTLFRGLEGLLKKRVSAARIRLACRQIALEAGRHSKTIGKDLIAIEIDCTGHIYSSHYSEEGTETMLLPDMLSLQGGSTQMTVSTGVSRDQAMVRVRGKIIKQPMMRR